MTDRVTCPYCNAAVPLPAPSVPRAACPRCGESFAVKADPDAPPRLPDPSANGTPAAAPPPAPPARSLVVPGLIGLSLGLTVVGVGIYAFFFAPPKQTPTPNPGEVVKPAATVPPLAVAGLAYLPADAAIAFAVQPGPLLRYAENAKADPRQLLLAAGVPEKALAVLDASGVKLDQIDTICGSVTPTDNALPRLVLVLTLRAELPDEAALFRELKATKPASPRNPTHRGVTLGPLPMELVKPDPRTYLFALDGKDLDAKGGRGSAHLSAGLRESAGKLSPASAAWAATDAADWAANGWVKLLLKDRPDDLARLAGVRALAAGLALGPTPEVTAAVRRDKWEVTTKPFDPKAGWNPLGELPVK